MGGVWWRGEGCEWESVMENSSIIYYMSVEINVELQLWLDSSR